METTEQDYLQRARIVLNEILGNVPKLKVEWDNTRGYQYPAEVARLVDFTLNINHDDRSYSVVGEFKAHGFPQQLTQAIDQMLRYRHKTTRGGDQLMVVAPYITPEGAKLCREDNVSYFDLAGNCRIAMGLLYIERTGIPNPFQKNVMAAPSLYGMRGERILRTLLTDPKKAWKVAPLASQVGVSAGTVSIVRNLLIERDWAKDTPDGMLLTQPDKLLHDWAQVWGRRAFRPFGYFGRGTVQELEKKLGDFARTQDRSIALTGAAAAWRYAPMTRYQRTQVYWDGEPQELADLMDWKKTDSGANVHILTPRDRGVFDGRQMIDGVPVVGPIQTFLDLQRDPARGQEAADHLRQNLLLLA